MVSFKALCPTRWCVRVRSLGRIITHYPALLGTLQKLREMNDKCSASASGLLRHFERYETLFAVTVLHRFFELCESLAVLLQTKSVTLSGSLKAANALITRLRELNCPEEFNYLKVFIDENAKKFDLVPATLPRVRKVPAKYRNTRPEPDRPSTIREYLWKFYADTLESLISEISRRFDQANLSPLVEIETIFTEKLWSDSPERTALLKSHELNTEMLKHQMAMFKKTVEENCGAPETLLEWIESFCSLHKDVQKILKEVETLVHLLLVIPSSTATGERSFSLLRRVKSYLRSTMTQQRLNHLCILHAYKDMVNEIDIDRLMDEFINRNERRVLHFGKK